MLASDLPPFFALGFAFVLGATWGSFFNVAIYRWPREMSVVTPPSHCPACGKPVPAWRNVPIFAYLWQRGRAACCGAAMTPRYLFVEVLSGVLMMALAQRYFIHAPRGTELSEAGLTLASWFVFVGGLVIATFVDLEHMEIPDEVSIGGTALGLATMALRAGGDDAPTPLELALGAGAGYLAVMLLLVWAWERWTGRRGMGEGDAKLMLFIGVFLGWKGVLFALVAGSVQGVAAVLASRALGRPITLAAASADTSDDGAEPAKDAAATEPPAQDAPKRAPDDDESDEPDDGDAGLGRIPFGPFLAVAALEFLFFGPQLERAYLEHFMP